MPRVLIDTNVLVYAHDRGEPAKQAIAVEVLDHLHMSGQGLLSVQCLSEFFSITTSKLKAKLTISEAAKQVELLAASWPVLELTPFVVLEATRGVRVHKMAFWDAQVWASARLNQVPLVLSEDFSTGAVLEGVRFVNPFVPRFDMEAVFGTL
jgi:predicted nucleic acid-binding protein